MCIVRASVMLQLDNTRTLSQAKSSKDTCSIFFYKETNQKCNLTQLHPNKQKTTNINRNLHNLNLVQHPVNIASYQGSSIESF